MDSKFYGTILYRDVFRAFRQFYILFVQYRFILNYTKITLILYTYLYFCWLLQYSFHSEITISVIDHSIHVYGMHIHPELSLLHLAQLAHLTKININFYHSCICLPYGQAENITASELNDLDSNLKIFFKILLYLI